MLTSYLVLFINFYMQTYKKPAKGKRGIDSHATAYTHGKSTATSISAPKLRSDLVRI